MIPPTPTIELGELLAHEGWVRRLAHRLVGDPELADDLSQETLLAALESEGRPIRSTRAWLRSVLRNLLSERARGEHRRLRREQKVARVEAVPSSAEVVERVEAHRSVVNAVMDLPDHYRLILLRRYFAGETPMRIAEALDMPVGTVKTRLQRGLDQLRQRLDQDHGGDDVAWRAALAPLIGGVPFALPVTGGATTAMALSTKAWIVLASASLLGVAWLAWPDGDAEPREEGLSSLTAAPAEAQVRTSSELTARSNSASPDPRAFTPAAPTVVREEVLALLPPRPLRGTVRDLDGRARAGVLLEFEPAWELPTDTGSRTVVGFSASDGSFELDARGSGIVRAAGTDVATLFAGVAANSQVRDGLDVVVSGARELHGVVRDDKGRPRAGARVEVLFPENLLARYGRSARFTFATRHEGTSDGEGRFAFPRLPDLESLRLRVRLDGYETYDEEPGGAPLVEVSLHPLPAGPGTRRGRVLRDDGTPAEGAIVSCSMHLVRCEADGSFAIDTWRPGPGGSYAARLIAVLEGAAPTWIDASGADDQGRPLWPADLLLRLGPVPASLEGRVVDENGRAMGAKVWIADPTLLRIEKPDSQNDEWRLGAHPDLAPPRRLLLLESLLANKAEASWRTVRTDENGAFEIVGLAARPYRLVAMDPSTLQVVELEGVEPGDSELELVLDRSKLRARLDGRLLDAGGDPVEGVHVYLQRSTFAIESGGVQLTGQARLRHAMVTGPEGEFWMRDVPHGKLALRIEGGGIVPRLVPLDEGAFDEPLELVVTRRLALRVLLANPDRAELFEVLDDAGKPLPMQVLEGPRVQVFEAMSLRDGRSPVFHVDESARWIRFLIEDSECGRVEIEKDGKTPLVVRF